MWTNIIRYNMEFCFRYFVTTQPKPIFFSRCHGSDTFIPTFKISQHLIHVFAFWWFHLLVLWISLLHMVCTDPCDPCDPLGPQWWFKVTSGPSFGSICSLWYVVLSASWPSMVVVDASSPLGCTSGSILLDIHCSIYRFSCVCFCV